MADGKGDLFAQILKQICAKITFIKLNLEKLQFIWMLYKILFISLSYNEQGIYM